MVLMQAIKVKDWMTKFKEYLMFFEKNANKTEKLQNKQFYFC